MKKLFLLLFVSLIGISCSVNDDSNNYHYEILPVAKYELPETFNFGQTYALKIFYTRPNDCHFNSALYFEKNGQTRIIAIQSLVTNDKVCSEPTDIELLEWEFNFTVVNATPYLFKFYKGDDEQGQPIFEEVTVNVTAEN